MTLRRHCAAMLLCLLALGAGRAARAQTVAPDPQQLYRDALQSITEGRRGDASDTLRRVIEQEPMHAGAWLDLALIQCSLGHKDEAERLFDAIEQRFQPPPEIEKLITAARAQGCTGWEPRNQYSVTLGRGIDQNVNQGATSAVYQPATNSGQLVLLSDFLPKHDQYALVSLDYLRDLTPNGTEGFVQFQEHRNDHLHQYDTSALTAGVDTPWRYGDWTLRGTGTLGLTWLGGQLYQRQAQVMAQLAPPVPLPDGLQLTVNTGLTHVVYQTLSNFDGNTAELRPQLTYRGGDDYVSASLAALDDRASDDRPGGNRHGSTAVLQWRRPLAGHLNGELGYVRQNWHSQSAYSPGLIDEVRDQSTRTWHATLTYALGKSQNLLLDLRQVRNKENISIFQYNDRQLQLSWQWLGL
jgi:hypothetical protein